MFYTATIYGGLFFLVILVWHGFRSWYRLRHVPGPFLASISVVWMLRKALSGRFHEYLRDVSEQYGPLVRIGPNELLSTDPNVLRMMSAVRSPYTKGDFYETGRIIPEKHTVVSLRDDVAHRMLRAKMSIAFSGKGNKDFGFSAGIDHQILALVNLINSKYISSTTDYHPVQFFQKISNFTLDVIGEISFGGAFGYLKEDCDLYNYHEISESSLPIMNVLSVVPWLTKVAHKWPFNMMLPKEGDRVGFGRLMGVAKSWVDMRLQPGVKPRKDMMQAFIDNSMIRSELMQQVLVQIVSGSMSMTAAICMTLSCLITTPSAYRALQREIDESLDVDEVNSPITNAYSKRMPYLQAQVPKGGDVINGPVVPEGTQVGMNFFGLMRSKEIWGPDADIFRPDRWLEADYNTLKKMNSNMVDLDFGFGKYQCLGKPLAMMELNKIFIDLLRRYDFMAVNPQAPIRARSAIFWSPSDFWLRITKRSPTSNPEDRQQDT
ncbi:cytochrome P450 [Camillea tinctor]|nr:cytochrome P450 [Camillea tinctor]